MLGFKAGETIHEPGGCERCGGTGYRGRNGVFEVLEMTDDGARADRRADRLGLQIDAGRDRAAA